MAVLIVLTVWLILAFCVNIYTWKHCSITQTGEFCTRLRECQKGNMNDTFNTLIAACREILELQRIHESKINMTAFQEQVCWQYCATMVTVEFAEYKEKCEHDMSKLHSDIQRLLQRQSSLRLLLQGRWQQTMSIVFTDSILGSIQVLLLVPLAVTILMVAIVVSVRMFHAIQSRLATIEKEKENLEVQVNALREENVALADEAQLLKGHFNEQQQQTEEILLDSENRFTELAAWNRRLQEQLNDRKERNALLAGWNVELYEEDSKLHSKINHLSKKYQECKEKLAQKNKELQNAHKFWRRWQDEEKKARQTTEEKYNSLVSTVKSTEMTLKLQELKQKRRLTVEILRCHQKICELESLQKQQVDSRETEKHLMLMKKMENLEKERILLMQENKRLEVTLTVEMEKHEIACGFERKRTICAIERNSSLEREIVALKEQTARLEEGLLTKVSKSTKRAQLLLLSQHKNQASQTMDDWRLNDFQKECESRFVNLQKTIDNLTKETDEVSLLKETQEELRTKLEVANKRCTILENLLLQSPYQSQVLMCNFDGVKLKTNGWSQRKLSGLNLITGLQKADTSFLTPPPVVGDRSLEMTVGNYLSIQ